MDIIVDGTDRRQKYPTKVATKSARNIDGDNKTGEKITIIKDKLQRPKGRISGILVDVSGPKTIIEFSESNKRFVDPVLNALKKQGAFPWNRTYRGSSITTRIGGLKDSDIEKIKNLIEETIRL